MVDYAGHVRKMKKRAGAPGRGGGAGAGRGRRGGAGCRGMWEMEGERADAGSLGLLYTLVKKIDRGTIRDRGGGRRRHGPRRR